jgi:DUF4097 and DUF4098 domain-containing protein YvlB
MARTKWRTSAPWCVVVLGVVVLAMGGCGDGPSEPTHESSEIRQAAFGLSGSPTVDVTTSNGRVTVRGQTGLTEVRVTITLHNRGTSIARAENRVDEMLVLAAQEGDRIVLRYDSAEQPEVVREHGSVDFDVTMPIVGDVSVSVGTGAVDVKVVKGTVLVKTRDGEIAAGGIVGALDARTSNGRIDVTQVWGAVRLASANGRLRMTEIEGSIDAETTHGNVLFSGRPIGASHRIRTTMGTIEVELPSDLSITIDATASDGIETDDLRLDGDTEGRDWLATLNPPADATLELFTSNGRIEIRAAE